MLTDKKARIEASAEIFKNMRELRVFTENELYDSLEWVHEHTYFPQSYLRKYLERLRKASYVTFKDDKYYLE